VDVILVLCLVWAIAEAAALDFNENIEVNGGGKLISKTNAAGGMDMIFGEGYQKYTRNISQEKASSSLSSKYSLNGSTPKRYNYMRSFKIKSNPLGLGPTECEWVPYSEEFASNRYMIQMRGPNNLLHGVNVYGTNAIESSNTISFRDGKVKTSYDIEGAGVLKEAVVNFNVPKKPDYIVDTQISDTSFSLTSGLSDSALLGSEIDDLLNWARAATPVPASVSETPNVGPKRGMTGSPTGSQKTGNSEENQTSVGPGAIANTTPDPFAIASSESEDSAEEQTGGERNVDEELKESLTTKSVPNTITAANIAPADTSKKLVTGDPWETWNLNQPRAAVLVVSLENDPIPVALIGKVAQFDYYDNSAESTEDINMTGYTVSDKRGVRTVISEECDGSAICQDYTHISAPDIGTPVLWSSPFAQLDRLTVPFNP
jgi:hypothetical protein